MRPRVTVGSTSSSELSMKLPRCLLENYTSLLPKLFSHISGQISIYLSAFPRRLETLVCVSPRTTTILESHIAVHLFSIISDNDGIIFVPFAARLDERLLAIRIRDDLGRDRHRRGRHS